MVAIYFKDGVYVALDKVDKESEFYITNESKMNYLYGGRITIDSYSWRQWHIDIDGIRIIKYEDILTENFNINEVCAYLNAIEANGVDAFLENYKKSIEFLYTELKEREQKAETQLGVASDASAIQTLLSSLEKIRNRLFILLGMLFSLYTQMPAGLENEKVISVYQSLTNLLA